MKLSEFEEFVQKLKKTDGTRGKQLRARMMNIIFSELFVLPSEDDILNPALLSKEELAGCVSMAKTLERSQLWDMLLKDMKQVAARKAFNESTSFDDMLGAKYMLYTLDILEKKVSKLSKL